MALFIGSLTLFRIPDRSIGLSLATIFGVVGVLAVLSVFMLSKGLLIQRKRPVTGGAQALIGTVGIVRKDLTPDGTLAVHGELWTAHSTEGMIRTGERARVHGADGRTLLVRRIVD